VQNLLEGAVAKADSGALGWQRRWAVLTKDTFAVYTHEDGGIADGFLLEDVVAVRLGASTSRRVVVVDGGARSISCKLASADTAAAWVRARAVQRGRLPVPRPRGWPRCRPLRRRPRRELLTPHSAARRSKARGR